MQDDTIMCGLVPGRRIPEIIFEQIRDRILSGELKPGDRLPSERALIEVYHRSRPTIREALRMLERSGFIESIPGSGGAVIKEISPATVEQPLENIIVLKQISMADLYEFRIVNELAYTSWAAERRTDEDIKRLRLIIEKARGCKNDWRQFLNWDIEFHRAIVNSAKNGMARITHQVISRLISGVMLKGFLQLTDEERQRHYDEVLCMHSDLTEAIEKRDAFRAKSLIAEHLNNFKFFMDGE